MLREAFEFLTAQARKAAEPQEIHRDSSYVVVAMDGQIHQIDFASADRRHKVGTLESLISIANRFAEAATANQTDAEAEAAAAPAVTVWYNDGAVVAILDDAGHRNDEARLALELSDVFKVVMRLKPSVEGPRQFQPKQFIRLLKADLAGTLDPGVLLEKVRQIKFEGTTTTVANAGRDRESLGREITGRVESARGELPDEVVLSVPAYKTAGLMDRYPIRCAVDVDFQLCTFSLTPLPDEIERVYQMALGDISRRLDEGLNGDIPHYYGAP